MRVPGLNKAGYPHREELPSRIMALGSVSGVLAVPWGIFFFFAWAYAGSDAYVNIAALVLGPVIATIAIFARRLLLASGVYVVVALAEVLRPFTDTNDSFVVSAAIALIPLTMASVSAYLRLHRNGRS